MSLWVVFTNVHTLLWCHLPQMPGLPDPRISWLPLFCRNYKFRIFPPFFLLFCLVFFSWISHSFVIQFQIVLEHFLGCRLLHVPGLWPQSGGRPELAGHPARVGARHLSHLLPLHIAHLRRRLPGVGGAPPGQHLPPPGGDGAREGGALGAAGGHPTRGDVRRGAGGWGRHVLQVGPSSGRRPPTAATQLLLLGSTARSHWGSSESHR